jgi:heme exporter protein D
MSFMMPSCLFGGIAAILIATSSSLNGLFIITVQYFAYHVAITVLALRMLFGKELSLSISDYFNCLKFLAVLMFVAFYVNSILYDGVSNINFMYVASPPQSGLPFLTEKYGWLVYIAHYASLILICVSLFYIKPIVSAIKEKLSKKARLEEAKEREECTIS